MIRDLTTLELDVATAREADDHLPAAHNGHTCVRITDGWAITTGRPCDTCDNNERF